jgi:RNA polymerase sigma-70 factor, ECF subfamily
MAQPIRVEGEDDGDLMRLVQAGDTDAFAELFDRHSARAFRVAVAICRDAGDAEDVVQEGFLSIWRSRASYEDVANFSAWAMKIVSNRAIDSVRRKATRPHLQTGGDDARRPRDVATAPSSQDAVMAESDRSAMLTALQFLPDAQVEVILLAYYGELTHSEIAAQLGLPPGTVKGRMRLRLEKLRNEMANSS